MHEISIRQATPGDLVEMTRLLHELFSIEQDFCPDAEKQLAGLKLLLASNQAYVVVAELEGKVVGMATVQVLISTAQGGATGLIEDVVVSRSQRGKGLGKALLEHLQRWAESQGLSRLQLLADRDNEPALAFYQNLGWSETRLMAMRRMISAGEQF